MGYDLHITRKEHWADHEEELNIRPEEWSYYLQSDPEMRYEGDYEINFKNGKFNTKDKTLATWSANPTDAANGDEVVLFYLYEGEISVKNSDQATISKMVEIAVHLNARVQGDDGEFYSRESDSIKTNINKSLKRPWWKIW
jgi:hypothetical protein